MNANQTQRVLRLRLVTLLIGTFFLAGCSLWSDVSGMFDTNRSPSDKEIESFMGSIKVRNGDPETMYRLAVHYQKIGHHDWAIDEFRKILAVMPTFARAYNGIGVSLDHHKKYQIAEKAYRKALAIDPKLDCAWNNLGYSALLQDRPEDAAVYFEKALALRNNNPRYHNNLAIAMRKLGRQDDERSNASAKAPHQAAIPQGVEGNHEYISHKSAPPPIPATESVEVILSRNTSGPPTLKIPDFARDISENHGSASETARQNNARRVIVHPSKISASDVTFTITPVTRIRELHREQRISSPTLTKGPFQTALSNNHFSTINSAFRLVDADKLDTKIDNFDGPYIEIANGNGVTGMAACVKRFLKRQGLPVIRASNADHFGYAQTKLIYSNGYLQQAWSVAKAIPGQQIFVKVKKVNTPNVDIKVVLGKDMKPYHHSFENS